MRKGVQMSRIEGNYYNKYESKNEIEKRLMQSFFSSMDSLLKSAEVYGNANCYEVGCGEGYITQHIKTYYPRYSVSASDISEDIISTAKVRVPGVDFFIDDACALKPLDNSYDLLIASEVLEHVANPRKAMDEFRRVSRKYLLLSVPREPIWRMANMVRGKYWRDFGNTPGHLNHWSKLGFLKFVSSYGEVIRIETPFPWTMVLMVKG
jgi:ubiquinone/menaquinone biosynthesis C-methylase UbiE